MSEISVNSPWDWIAPMDDWPSIYDAPAGSEAHRQQNPHEPPKHLRSIHVTTGGAFYNALHGGLKYVGGVDVYIHYICPPAFFVRDFFQALIKAKATRYLPGRVWYTKFNKDWPEGLKPIQCNRDIQAMFKDMEDHGEVMARVFTQDVEYVIDWRYGGGDLKYVIPYEVPTIRGKDDIRGLHMDAVEREITEIEVLGHGRIAADEARGRRWYVTTESKPIPAQDVYTEVGNSRPCDKTIINLLHEDVIRPRGVLVKIGKETAVPKTNIIEEDDTTLIVRRR